MSFLEPFPGDSADAEDAAPAGSKVLGRWRVTVAPSARESSVEQRRVVLFQGDLARAPAQVVCVSTNPRLTLLGGTGAAVLEAGGWSIRREADEIREEHEARTGAEGLEPGSVHPTGPGRLPHRLVLLCVASGPSHRSSAEVIRQCVHGVLERVAAEGAVSVAMPVFGAGHAGFPFEQSLEAMVCAWREAPVAGGEIVLSIDQADLAQRAADILDAALDRERPSGR